MFNFLGISMSFKSDEKCKRSENRYVSGMGFLLNGK
jgi:hypothetical protein